MNRVLFFFIFLFSLGTIRGLKLTTEAYTGGHCVWYGQCGPYGRDGGAVDCNYTGPPIQLQNQLAIQQFEQLCPDLFEENPDLVLCCDGAMLNTFNQQVQQASTILARCPACYHNFERLWCYLTCHPQQSEFLEPTVFKVPEKTSSLLSAWGGSQLSSATIGIFRANCV